MSSNLCEHCTAMCCRYIALPIDEPEDRDEFDDIRWYLLHENISIFVEDGDWYIYIAADCRHLLPDHRCGLYETRPNICRQYSAENCDYHSGEYGWEQHFTCPEHLDEFVREYFANNKKPTRKKNNNSDPKRAKAKSRTKLVQDYAGKTADIRGVPLPKLGKLR